MQVIMPDHPLSGINERKGGKLIPDYGTLMGIILGITWSLAKEKKIKTINFHAFCNQNLKFLKSHNPGNT